MVVVSMFAVIATTWIIAWHIGSQAAIAGAVVMTIVLLGVLVIYLSLNSHHRRI